MTGTPDGPAVQPYAVRSIGSVARRALEEGDTGRVLAVFRRSLYVEMADGRLACLGALSLGDGPLNARCDLPDALIFDEGGPPPGEDVLFEGSRVAIGGALGFDLEGSASWRPPPSPDLSVDTMERGLARLGRSAGVFSGDMGLGRLIQDPAFQPDGADMVLDRAAIAIAALTEWLRTAVADPDGATPPPGDGDVLIGLGAGLTPSGDDWIGGAMIALRTLGRPDVARRLAGWALPLAQMRTGKISIAHLAAAAGGEGAAALHAAIHAVCADDGPAIDGALRGIDAIGHSSGWDALAGAQAAMSSCLGSEV